jgi:ABC-type dipeptide/oligopeptide/nickel transport system permease component
LGRFLWKRLLHLVTVLLGISLLSFILANIADVDPAESYAIRISKTANEALIEQYRNELGFNRSIPQQYLRWLKNIVRLDFGNSYITGRPAMGDLLAVMPITLLLAGMSCTLILITAIPLGILAAHREGTWIDKLIMGLSFVSISVPGYFLGLLCLLVFGIYLNVMPIVGHGHPVSLLCAALVLSLPMTGSLSRILRSLLLENKKSEHVTYAKARGVGRRRMMINHLLRNAAPSCIVMYGQNIGYLIAGTAIVETIFSAQGLGQYALTAAINRDFPVINAYIVLMALCFVVCNVAAEGCGRLLNPGLSREERI